MDATRKPVFVDVAPPPDDGPDADVPIPPLPPGAVDAYIAGVPFAPVAVTVAPDNEGPHERAQRLMAAENAPETAVRTLAAIMRDTGAPAGARVSAADSVLDRTPGFARRQAASDADARALSELPLAVLTARLAALQQRRADLLAIPAESREIVPDALPAQAPK